MCLISSAKLSEDIPTHVRKLVERAADNSSKGQWWIALELSTIALGMLGNILESDSRDIGLILSIIGFINTKVDEYDEAESFWKRAILILEKYDQDLDFVIKILWKLLKSLIKIKRYEEAEFFGKKAIGIYKKLDKIDTFQYFQQKAIIGEVCLQLKKPNEAKEFLKAALLVYARKFGIGSVQVKEIFGSLEAAYFWKNTIAESRESFENSNGITDATPLCLLGMFCEDENFFDKACDYYRRAVRIYESEGFSDHSQLADISLKLGKCYLEIGNCLGSQLYLNKSRDIYKKTLADDDPVMLDVRIHLALCCVKTARLDEARKIYEEILGNVHRDGSDVSILKLAEDYEKSGEDKVPILDRKSNIIDCALKNLSALYVLDGKYRAAKILQAFGVSKHDRIKNDGI